MVIRWLGCCLCTLPMLCGHPMWATSSWVMRVRSTCFHFSSTPRSASPSFTFLSSSSIWPTQSSIGGCCAWARTTKPARTFPSTPSRSGHGRFRLLFSFRFVSFPAYFIIILLPLDIGLRKISHHTDFNTASFQANQDSVVQLDPPAKGEIFLKSGV